MSILPAYWHGSVVRGADFRVTFAFHADAADGPPVDLTGAVVTVTVSGRWAAVTYRSSDPSPKVTHTGTGGVVAIALSEADTLAFHHGTHGFDLTVAFADGTTNRHVCGRLSFGCLGSAGSPAVLECVGADGAVTYLVVGGVAAEVEFYVTEGGDFMVTEAGDFLILGA